MTNYLLCRPEGGFNDTLSIIVRAWNYAIRYNRTLIIDTTFSGIHDNFSNYFQLKAEAQVPIEIRLHLDTQLQLELEKSSVRPHFLRKNGKTNLDYQSCYDYTIPSLIESSSGKPLTFDFYQDCPEQLLVCHQTGSKDYNELDFLKYFTFTPTIAGKINARLAMLNTHSYHGIHIRNTDYRSDYRSFFKKIRPGLQGKRVLVCSDDLDCYFFAKKFLTESEVLSTGSRKSLSQQPLHARLFPCIPNSIFMSDGQSVDSEAFYRQQATKRKQMIGSPEQFITNAEMFTDLITLCHAVQFHYPHIYTSLLSLQPGNLTGGFTRLIKKLRNHTALLSQLLNAEQRKLVSLSSCPLISIIILVTNPASYIRRCLDSLVGQTYHTLEIICIADDLTDDSLKVLQEYQQCDQRVQVIFTTENQGRLASHLRGFEIAQGDYLLTIDSDDWLAPTIIKELVTTAIAGQADLVHFQTESVSQSGNRKKWGQENKTLSQLFYKHPHFDITGETIPPDSPGKLFHKTVIARVLATRLLETSDRIDLWADMVLSVVIDRYVSCYVPLRQIGYFNFERNGSINKNTHEVTNLLTEFQIVFPLLSRCADYFDITLSSILPLDIISTWLTKEIGVSSYSLPGEAQPIDWKKDQLCLYLTREGVRCLWINFKLGILRSEPESHLTQLSDLINLRPSLCILEDQMTFSNSLAMALLFITRVSAVLICQEQNHHSCCNLVQQYRPALKYLKTVVLPRARPLTVKKIASTLALPIATHIDFSATGIATLFNQEKHIEQDAQNELGADILSSTIAFYKKKFNLFLLER